jgi:hypothetical protein
MLHLFLDLLSLGEGIGFEVHLRVEFLCSSSYILVLDNLWRAEKPFSRFDPLLIFFYGEHRLLGLGLFDV